MDTNRTLVILGGGLTLGVLWAVWQRRQLDYAWWRDPRGVRGAPWYSRLSPEDREMARENETAYHAAVEGGDAAEARGIRFTDAPKR